MLRSYNRRDSITTNVEKETQLCKCHGRISSEDVLVLRSH